MSSVSYTYVTAVKNVTLLMSTIQNLFGKRVENYDYNATSSELVITFTSELSTDEIGALDTLVKTYIDSNVLETEDVLAFRNIRTYKSVDQTVLTTLNALTEVTFQSTSQIDSMYYQMGISNKFIYIQKPGIYLIIAKVGACLDVNAIAGTNTVLQWTLSTDELRTELVYMNILNSNTYTCHTNMNNMTDSTICACVLNVTSVTGLNLRLTAKRILGTSPLVIDNDQTAIQIMSIPGVSYYEGNMTTSVTLNTTTASNVNFNANRLIQYPFTHTVGQPNVTVTQAGKVLIFAKATFNKTAGTDVSAGMFFVRLNGTAISDMASYTHTISSANNKTTKHIIGVKDVVPGDVISLQAKTTQGTNIQIVAAETGLILAYIHPLVLNDLSLSCVRNEVASSTPITTTGMDLVFSSNLSTYGTSISAGTGYYQIVSAGMYLINAVITVSNASGITRECGVYFYTSVDAGKTYYLVPSSLGIKQTNPAGKTTVATTALVNLPVNSRVKIQVASNGVTGDNILLVDNCVVTMINFVDPTFTIIPDTNFGSKFTMINSPDSVVVSTVTYVEKCRAMRHDVDSGIYRVGSFLTFDTTTTTTINIQLVDTHATSGNSYIVYTKTVTYPAGTFIFSSADYVNSAEGSHVYLLQVSSPNAVTFSAKNALLEVWRAF